MVLTLIHLHPAPLKQVIAVITDSYAIKKKNRKYFNPLFHLMLGNEVLVVFIVAFIVPIVL